jgi:hypothetical protein
MGKVLVLRRKKLKKVFAYFHVLGLFIPKKHDLSDITRRCETKFHVARMLKFWFPVFLGPT